MLRSRPVASCACALPSPRLRWHCRHGFCFWAAPFLHRFPAPAAAEHTSGGCGGAVGPAAATARSPLSRRGARLPRVRRRPPEIDAASSCSRHSARPAAPARRCTPPAPAAARCPAGARPSTPMGWNPLSWFSKPEPPKKKKICCACPETKVGRGGDGRRPCRLVHRRLAHTIPHLTRQPPMLPHAPSRICSSLAATSAWC